MIFTTKRFIHFNQCDPAGILFYGESFVIAHQVIEEFIEVIGIGWSTWFENDEFAFPIRHTSCDYMLPIKAGGQVEFRLSIGTLSLSTVCFSVAAKSAKGIHFQVNNVHTTVGKNTLGKAEIPLNIHKKLTYFNDNKGTLVSETL